MIYVVSTGRDHGYNQEVIAAFTTREAAENYAAKARAAHDAEREAAALGPQFFEYEGTRFRPRGTHRRYFRIDEVELDPADPEES